MAGRRRPTKNQDMISFDDIDFDSTSDTDTDMDSPVCDSMDDGDYVPSEEGAVEEEGELSNSSDSDEEGRDINLSNITDSVPYNYTEWSIPNEDFNPRMELPSEVCPNVLATITSQSSSLDIFFKVFPLSLFMYIAQCTNERLGMLKKKVAPTTCWEVMTILGCTLVMAYNPLPRIAMYWSKQESLGNSFIKRHISRDRFMAIFSKIYVASPAKPADAGKTYYIDDMISCLKSTFMACREDSTFQSIDESMCKFKGRSSLKQYMPLKPVKRGIKTWMRSDAKTGYVYDMNIYQGKEDDDQNTTLGERVVLKLISTIRKPDVVLAFDRFFTSVRLLDTVAYPALGTCNVQRKHMPKIDGVKLNPGETKFYANNRGVMAAVWKDTKEVTVMSNCHDASMTTVRKKMKDGTFETRPCPEMISFYRKAMRGVDRSDQMAGLYELDRKSHKWWRKMFFRLLMMSTVNAWVLRNDVKRTQIPMISFLIELAEGLADKGKGKHGRKSGSLGGRPVKRPRNDAMTGHLPIQGPTRRRCSRCSSLGKELRTKQLCKVCKIPLCINCFEPHHK